MVSTVDFLGADYEVPQSSGGGGKYLKIKQGTTKFRVLSEKALKGFVYWTLDGKPKRMLEKPERTPIDIRLDDENKPERIRHFWAMAVWDYETSQVCILEVTQATIQSSLISLIRDEDWGHPSGYDIKITRDGSGIDTKYSVNPGKAGEIPAEAKAAYAKQPVNLDALLVGGDPFVVAPQAAPATITKEQQKQLIDAAKSAGFTEDGLNRIISEGYGFERRGLITVDMFPSILASVGNAEEAEKWNDVDYDAIPF